jgi:hypothetical protein
MVFYSILTLIVLSCGLGFLKSAMFRQLRRGRGADAGRFGSAWDHNAELGFGASWNDDGQGVRDSHIDSAHTHRKDKPV